MSRSRHRIGPPGHDSQSGVEPGSGEGATCTSRKVSLYSGWRRSPRAAVNVGGASPSTRSVQGPRGAWVVRFLPGGHRTRSLENSWLAHRRKPVSTGQTVNRAAEPRRGGEEQVERGSSTTTGGITLQHPSRLEELLTSTRGNQFRHGNRRPPVLRRTRFQSSGPRRAHLADQSALVRRDTARTAVRMRRPSAAAQSHGVPSSSIARTAARAAAQSDRRGAEGGGVQQVGVAPSWGGRKASRGGDHRGDRYDTAAESLTDEKHVRTHVLGVDAPPGAQPSHAGLDLVDDQHGAVRPATAPCTWLG